MLSPMFKALLLLKHTLKNAISDTNPVTAAAVQLSISNFTFATPSTSFLSLLMPFMSPYMGYGASGMLYPFGNPFFSGNADLNMFNVGLSKFGTGLSTTFMWTKSPPSLLPTSVQYMITEFTRNIT